MVYVNFCDTIQNKVHLEIHLGLAVREIENAKLSNPMAVGKDDEKKK